MREFDSVRVLIIEDHQMLAEALASALCGVGIAAAAVRPSSGDDVVRALRHLRPRLVLLDLDLGSPDVRGMDLITGLTASGVEVVVLTGCQDRAVHGACLERGALGVIRKDAGLTCLIEATRRALLGEELPGRDDRESLIAEVRVRRALDAQRLGPFMRLTRREAGVLRGLAAGKTVECIASESFVSVATVRTQVRAIFLKLGVRSQLAAVAEARRSGWLDEDSGSAA
jgi:DNA-binding NarL/FixJ family response regulator